MYTDCFVSYIAPSFIKVEYLLNHLLICQYSRLPTIILKPSRERENSSSDREFELSRVKLYRKRSEGKCKLLRVSGRFEL